MHTLCVLVHCYIIKVSENEILKVIINDVISLNNKALLYNYREALQTEDKVSFGDEVFSLFLYNSINNDLG